MQQVTTQEQVEYASLGWRIAAVLVDTAVLLGVLIIGVMVWAAILMAQGKVDANDPAAAQALAEDLGASDWTTNLVLFGAIFIYYTVLEGIFGASLGKLAFRMRVIMADGSRPTGLAVVVRNLIRIPEVWLLYIPAGVSCLASAKRQRLGDHVARTVVVRRRTAGAAGYGLPPQAPPGYGPPQAPPAFGQPLPPAPAPQPDPAGGAAPVGPPAPPPPSDPGGWAAPAPPSLDDALGRLKTAALATRGAHLSYLHFSERELTKTAADAAQGYSEGYVSAWFTLTDAVASLREAGALATSAAGAAGKTLEEACAGQADVAHLLEPLQPYASATTDEQIHEAFLAVARSETPAS
jgi:uncharacterized RDD family membrane protein YckC